MTVDIRAKDVFIVCSDELYSLVSNGEIARAVIYNEPQQACEHLIGQANDRGGHDNITVIVADVQSAQPVDGPRPNTAQTIGQVDVDEIAMDSIDQE